MTPRKPRARLRQAPPRPRWSHRAFAAKWDEYLRTHPKVKATWLVDRMRECAPRVDKATGEVKLVTSATIYNWRKGVGRPEYEEAVDIAKVLGCKYEDFAE